MRWIVLLLLLPAPAYGQFFGGHPFKPYCGGGFCGPYAVARFQFSFNYSSPFCGPFGCPAPFYGGAFYPFSPPVWFVTPQPIVAVQAVPLDLGSGLLPARFDEEIPRDINLDDFIVVRPGRRNVPRAVPEKLPPFPKFPEPLAKVAPLPLEPKREAEPRLEMNRQLELGKSAMSQGEFGRARFRFEEATRVAPGTASGYFYLAQAEFALGKYREAVASVVEGLKRRPDWSTARFQPRELYGNDLGRMDLHLQELRNALAEMPDDPALLFLLGYQLWFEGRREEGIPLLEKSADRSQDPEPVLTFLRGGMMVRTK